MLNPSIATFLVTLINIVILFVILRALLFKPVTKFIEDRSKKIEDSIAQADHDKAQAKTLLEQYEEQLKNAGTEAEAIIHAARESAERESERIIAEGKARAENLINAAQAQIRSEQQAALVLFKAEAATLVVAAASQLIRRDLNQDDNRRLAASLLQEVAAPSGPQA
ncbi:MAG: F0F1 ATP synthase subunit B [Treponema sp.]|jgi:F-type H+-transporting ATPase subunit b|nr:F0F1 ATP synthase subunit B [Treponema sp.]